MKAHFFANFLAAAALLAGCVSHPRAVVLDPIGPPSLPAAPAGSTGTLVVYSAFDTRGDFNRLPYLRQYTDYQLLGEDGTLRQTVHNSNGLLVEAPKRLELPAGAYRVVAHANGFGLVTVPVVIRARQVTTVHLEGGAAWPNNAALLRSNPVRLPDGEIAGWRADTELPNPP
jgi:hypothetical protein